MPSTPPQPLDYEALLTPTALLGRAEVLARPCPVPALPGVYAWYFDEALPGVPLSGCHRVLGHVLLYVGIAPKATVGAATKPSERTLRHRLRDHFRGNAEGSTLRLTLGCLLADRLGIELRRVGSGRRHTFTNAGEQVLDAWMAQHTSVAWMPAGRPWDIEHDLLSKFALPLNLQGNSHPFVSELKAIRRMAKVQALALPVVADNGGRRTIPNC